METRSDFEKDALIDSHAHLDDPRFAADLDEVLERALMAGVGHIITVGAGLESTCAAIALAEKHPGFLFATAGIHPHDADSVTDANMARLEGLAENPVVVGIGETGLDYYYDNSKRETQQAVFRRHIEIAIETNLPLIVHCRDAFADCLEILRQYVGQGLRGVAHCFSGDVQYAEAFLDVGLHISFSGVLTFKNARAVHEAAGVVPLDRILIETDCPYLAPVPKRGRRNEPAYVASVARALREIRRMDMREVARVTRSNTTALFGLAARS